MSKYILKPYAHLKPRLLGPMYNIVIQVGTTSRTLFSCHTDTVHSKSGKQNIKFDHEVGLIYKPSPPEKKQKTHVKGANAWVSHLDSWGDCLGADDTTGVWIMLEMIDRGIPGTYIFHRGEERGGIGSGWIADHKKEWLTENFDRAIAFDRKNETSVITQQSCGVCCSNEFALDLCAKLGSGWVPDSTGTFTDTANYAFLIPECTNLSVGYNLQHTAGEYQDLYFAEEILDRFCLINWSKLPIVRDPVAAEEQHTSRFAHYLPAHSKYEDLEFPDQFAGSDSDSLTAQHPLVKDLAYLEFTAKDILDMDYDDLVAICDYDPDWAAGLIYTAADKDFQELLADADGDIVH